MPPHTCAVGATIRHRRLLLNLQNHVAERSTTLHPSKDPVNLSTSIFKSFYHLLHRDSIRADYSKKNPNSSAHSTMLQSIPTTIVDRSVHRFEDMGGNERGQGACNENRLYQGQGVSYKIRALKASRTNGIITDLIKKVACSHLSLPISATPRRSVTRSDFLVGDKLGKRLFGVVYDFIPVWYFLRQIKVGVEQLRAFSRTKLLHNSQRGRNWLEWKFEIQSILLPVVLWLLMMLMLAFMTSS
ncbi:hypothetical protein L2E82_38413 [Cichorium intybus]|uniref:Uncharacterized protein n=1 Tax=Cichorium intybus TaxID=13427 RepID=A0ACB9AGP5_CICIN|nr:hypothetical protein L2E82_38413 [Cichorium intybus]